MRLARAEAEVDRRADGTLVVRSPRPLAPYARCAGEWLEQWAERAPRATFLAERAGADWRRVTYAEARDAARAIGAALIDLGASPERPVMILGDDSIDHALVALGAMHAGIPAAPISPAYSLVARDFAKLRSIAAQVGPGVVYCDERAPFAAALDAIATGAPLVTSRGGGVATVAELARTTPGDALARAFAAVTPDTVAKILFTSGSTGAPKGVVNTQRMLCSNQQAIAQCWPFLEERPPLVVDWLPWSHTFGGNHNFDLVLRNGGALYVDAGKPAPGRFDATLTNLRDVSPTLYFNVPRGFEMLAAALETDEALRARFFAELDLLFYAGAALPQSTWERLEAVRAKAGGRALFVSAWGATETSPLVTSVHFPIPRAGVIGLPAPGCELKMVPVHGKLEMRVRGPNVTPGYWRRGGGVSPLAVDDEGYWATGDAGKLQDPSDASRGICFDGRTAENFKLTSGTWVAVGELRLRVIARCAPLVSDAVVAGHDRDAIAVMLFVSPAVDLDPLALRARLHACLSDYNAAHGGSSTRVARAIVLAEPPSIDAGEITDKGYLNQRAILDRRAGVVEALYAAEPEDEVIVLD